MAMASVGPARSDGATRADVLFELKHDLEIISSGIVVSARNGVVTLTGYVFSYGEKKAAERAAQRVYGVQVVVNHLQTRLADFQTDPEIATDRSCARELPKQTKRRRASRR